MSLSSFESKLEHVLKKRGDDKLLRKLEVNTQGDFLDFSTNDYFALANDRIIANNFHDYFRCKGLGSGASRLISGNHCAYVELENNLAKYKKTEEALVFGSGYLAAIGVIPNLCGKGDLIIADKHIHKSSIDAIKLSGAKLLRYSHNDNSVCAQILERERGNYNNCLIVTETLFSMDGDYADVKGLYDLAVKYDSLLLLDDAHGLGLFQDYPENFDNRLMIMGTLSKALGSYGGYIACSKLLKSYLVNNASSLIYSTSLPEIVVSWANSALQQINQKKRKDLLEKISFFCKKIGIKDQSSPIVIVPYSNSEILLEKKSQLELENIKVGAIRPPTAKTPRLRITISLRHTIDDLKCLADFI